MKIKFPIKRFLFYLKFLDIKKKCMRIKLKSNLSQCINIQKNKSLLI